MHATDSLINNQEVVIIAAESIEEKLERVEKKAQKAIDIQEIMNVISMYAIMDAQGKNREQLNEIWAMNMPDVCWIDNDATWIGPEAVETHYADGWEKHKKEYLQEVLKINPGLENDPKNALIGHLKMHAVCSPIIEIAGDGQTAKGMFDSPGFATDAVGGEFRPLWTWGRMFVDFIKVDGKWKIWHFSPLLHFFAPYYKSWVDLAREGGRKLSPEEQALYDKAIKRCERYSTTKLCGPLTPGFPKPPEPYYTFSETFSYGP